MPTRRIEARVLQQPCPSKQSPVYFRIEWTRLHIGWSVSKERRLAIFRFAQASTLPKSWKALRFRPIRYPTSQGSVGNKASVGRFSYTWPGLSFSRTFPGVTKSVSDIWCLDEICEKQIGMYEVAPLQDVTLGMKRSPREMIAYERRFKPKRLGTMVLKYTPILVDSRCTTILVPKT